jgi:hypothetical protein
MKAKVKSFQRQRHDLEVLPHDPDVERQADRHVGQDEAGVRVPHLQRGEQDVERDGHQHGREHVREQRAEGERLLAAEGEAREPVAGQRGRDHVEDDGPDGGDGAVLRVHQELGGEEQVAEVLQRQVGARQLVGRAEEHGARRERRQQHPVEGEGDHGQDDEQRRHRRPARGGAAHRPTSTSREGSNSLK